MVQKTCACRCIYYFDSFACDQDGNVVCEEEKCPVLNCLLTEQLPGQCCPQCKGMHCHFAHNLRNGLVDL